MPIFQNSNSKFYDPYNVYNLGGFTGKRPDEYTKEDEDEYLAIPDAQVGVSERVSENDGSRRISTPDDIVGQAAETAARVGGGSAPSGEETDAWGQTKDAWGQIKDQWGQMYDGPDREPDGDIDDYYRTDGMGDRGGDRNGKERTAYDRYQDVVSQQPHQGKIPIWKRLVAGAIGGFGGYVNSSGRRGGQVDTTPITEGILSGDYRERYRKWQDQVAASRAAAEAEMKRNSDVNQDRRLDNAEELNRIQRDRWNDQAEYNKVRGENDRLKAESQKTKAGAAAMDAVTRANKITDMLKQFEELNPDATPEEKTRFLRGITGIERTRTNIGLKGNSADQAAGLVTKTDAEKRREAERAQQDALNAAKVQNLNDRGKAALASAAKKGAGSGTATPEQKRGQEIARKELSAARNEIKQVEDEIKALTASANAAKIIRQTYDDAVASKRQYSPEEARKHQDAYDKAGNVLDSIFVGPDGKQTGQYYMLQNRKAELYRKLKDLEAKYTNNPGWAAGFGEIAPPAPAKPAVQGPPPVAPPPAERKVKRPF